MVSKSIERAQKKVEENNFGIRKRLLEYDDVMNIQREAIYKKRRNALKGERLAVDLSNMFSGLTENMVLNHKRGGDFDSFRNESLSTIGMDPDMEESFFADQGDNEVYDAFEEKVYENYQRKGDQITELLLPIIKRVYENEGHKYKKISIPFTDGRKKPLNIAADLKEAIDSDGATIMRDIEKAVMLAMVDNSWKEHLRSMDELKESVQSASFEQKDPLVIYKMEAYDLFEQLIGKINFEVCSYLMKGKLMIGGSEDVKEAKEQRTDMSRTTAGREDGARRAAAMSAGNRRAKPETFKRQDKKVGRNEPCPCGSGKKYKKCHGAAVAS